MAVTLTYNKSSLNRHNLSVEQHKQIKSVYSQALNVVQQKEIQFKALPDSATKSLQLLRLNQLENDLRQKYNEISGEIETKVTGDMKSIAERVAQEFEQQIRQFYPQFRINYGAVSENVVAHITTGQVYEGNWTLSKAIWGQSQTTHNRIHEIIAIDVAANKSAYEIAKDIEKFVDPTEAKASRVIETPVYDWVNGERVDTGRTEKYYFGQVDYNAQRLARTLVSHAFQQSIIETAEGLPWKKKIRWLAAHTNRMCEICESRDGRLYELDEVPMDHPNGMCDFEIVIETTPEEIHNRFQAWEDGNPDPELDRYAEFLMRDLKKV